MGIEVVNIVENEDGSANIILNMSMDYLIEFAKVGLVAVLKEKCTEMLNESDSYKE